MYKGKQQNGVKHAPNASEGKVYHETLQITINKSVGYLLTIVVLMLNGIILL